MRVASNSIYETSKYQLGKRTENLSNSNIVVTTGKRINTLSDDPIGLTKVINLKSSISNINQLERNISTGRMWVEAGDGSLSGVKDLLVEAKVQAIAMRNDTVNEIDRKNVAAYISGIIKQTYQFANTQINGRYIFSGTKTETKPFVFDDVNNPTMVMYQGSNDPFKIKSGKDLLVTVGHDGESVFSEKSVMVDETNNMIDFKEIWDGGEALISAKIPNGNYTAQHLADIVQVAMRETSAQNGQNIEYDVTYDEANRSFTIKDGAGSNSKLTQLQLLWENGDHAGNNIAADMGFFHDNRAPASKSYTGETGVQWGIFKTLFDLKNYLETDNVQGIEKTITKIEMHFEHINKEITDLGEKGVMLDTREQILNDFNITLTTNRSKYEDADMIKAISDLKSSEIAYQASLASSSKVMGMSLVDYI
ncbi:MAG: flagellar hook-associated protein FlgL [Desulfobacterales bacterium]|nr:flagellar hook-associated protein FlgL [Desulfobacterales bacterium]